MKVEIHLIDRDPTIDRKEILELIQAKLIHCGVVKNVNINYGLVESDRRKFVQFAYTKKLDAFLRKNAGETTTIPTPPAPESA